MSTKSIFAIGENFRKLRLLHGYTQLEIAKQLCICRTSYLGYETGSRIPGVDTMLNVSRIYNVSVDLLYESDPVKFLEEVDNSSSDDLNNLICIYKSLPRSEQNTLLDFSRKMMKGK